MSNKYFNSALQPSWLLLYLSGNILANAFAFYMLYLIKRFTFLCLIVTFTSTYATKFWTPLNMRKKTVNQEYILYLYSHFWRIGKTVFQK